jgi:hypothetical protein
MGVNPIEQPTKDEWRGTTIEFPRYDPTQLVRSVTRGTLTKQSRRLELLATATEQDTTVRDLAEIELAQLETREQRLKLQTLLTTLTQNTDHLLGSHLGLMILRLVAQAQPLPLTLQFSLYSSG